MRSSALGTAAAGGPLCKPRRTALSSAIRSGTASTTSGRPRSAVAGAKHRRRQPEEGMKERPAKHDAPVGASAELAHQLRSKHRNTASQLSRSRFDERQLASAAAKRPACSSRRSCRRTPDVTTRTRSSVRSRRPRLRCFHRRFAKDRLRHPHPAGKLAHAASHPGRFGHRQRGGAQIAEHPSAAAQPKQQKHEYASTARRWRHRCRPTRRRGKCTRRRRAGRRSPTQKRGDAPIFMDLAFLLTSLVVARILSGTSLIGSRFYRGPRGPAASGRDAPYGMNTPPLRRMSLALSTANNTFPGIRARILKEIDDCIEFELEPITEADVADFRRATWSSPLSTVPLTFATRFRWGEFRWLTRLDIQMQDLLHAEQEYRWDRALVVGDAPGVRTWLRNRASVGACVSSCSRRPWKRKTVPSEDRARCSSSARVRGGTAMSWTVGMTFEPVQNPPITGNCSGNTPMRPAIRNPVHLDDAFATSAGFPTVIVHGMLVDGLPRGLRRNASGGLAVPGSSFQDALSARVTFPAMRFAAKVKCAKCCRTADGSCPFPRSIKRAKSRRWRSGSRSVKAGGHDPCGRRAFRARCSGISQERAQMEHRRPRLVLIQGGEPTIAGPVTRLGSCRRRPPRWILWGAVSRRKCCCSSTSSRPSTRSEAELLARGRQERLTLPNYLVIDHVERAREQLAECRDVRPMLDRMQAFEQRRFRVARKHGESAPGGRWAPRRVLRSPSGRCSRLGNARFEGLAARGGPETPARGKGAR